MLAADSTRQSVHLPRTTTRSPARSVGAVIEDSNCWAEIDHRHAEFSQHRVNLVLARRAQPGDLADGTFVPLRQLPDLFNAFATARTTCCGFTTGLRIPPNLKPGRTIPATRKTRRKYPVRAGHQASVRHLRLHLHCRQDRRRCPDRDSRRAGRQPMDTADPDPP